MIKINLHDYREELQRIEIQKHVLKAGYIMMLALCLVCLHWMWQKNELTMTQMEVQALDQKVSALEGTVRMVKGMQAKQKRVDTILAGIDNLRTSQMQATEILSDLNQELPEEIWLTGIKQSNRAELARNKIPTIFFADASKDSKKKKKKKSKKKKKGNEPQEFIVITGQALEDQAVARFVDRLELIPYFKMVFLYKTEQKTIGKTKIREFEIYCYMPDTNNKALI